ncbi:hypothetical protein BDV12DRAFT_205147 [Aspergillus spectabilis]
MEDQQVFQRVYYIERDMVPDIEFERAVEGQSWASGDISHIPGTVPGIRDIPQPAEGDQPAVQLLANLYTVYEFGYGILMMWLQSRSQYCALTMTIEMSVFIHVTFAAVVWRRGAPRGKVYTNLAIAAIFGLWYHWSANSPEEDYKVTVNYASTNMAKCWELEK